MSRPSSKTGSNSDRLSSKRVTFGFDSSYHHHSVVTQKKTPTASAAANGSLSSSSQRPASSAVASYVRQVKKVILVQQRRADDYRQFVACIRDIVFFTDRSESAPSTAAIDVVEQIERIVSLLDGHPDLVDGLKTILPCGYTIDIQPDAVVVKVRRCVVAVVVLVVLRRFGSEGLIGRRMHG